MTRTTRYFDDNPATIDLLGFDVVVEPVVSALVDARLDPITVGVHAPWGAGKTTVLGLLEQALASHGSDRERIVVVRTSPWEYDDHADVKGTLIGEVLGTLSEEFKGDESFTKKAKALFDRVAWARLGRVAVTGALGQFDLNGLLDALRPVTDKGQPTTLAGFRSEFEKALAELPTVRRVVVLVDDLDRCLPTAVMATLEAIKLFLSVKRMAFVIAADTDMVQDSVEASLGEMRKSQRFAREYLDKIVQLPVQLPTLTEDDSEAYATLLIASHLMGDEAHRRLLDHIEGRRRKQRSPYAGGTPEEADFTVPQEAMSVASRVVAGLGHLSRNPRSVKRFLNALETRQSIAAARGVELTTAVIAKLFVLEHRLPTDFSKMLEWRDADRLGRIEDWEDWARGDSEAEPPHGVSAESRTWAASEPMLVHEQLGAYLSLAATLDERNAAVGHEVPDWLLTIRDALCSDSDASSRRAATEDIAELLPEERLELIDVITKQMRVNENPDRHSGLVRGLVRLAEVSPDHADLVAERLRASDLKRLRSLDAAQIASSNADPVRAVGQEIAENESLEASVRKAAGDFVRQEG